MELLWKPGGSNMLWVFKCRRRERHREDGLQLVLIDLPVPVLIEQLEVPLQLLVDLSLQQQADGRDVLHKVNVAVLQTQPRALEPIKLSPGSCRQNHNPGGTLLSSFQWTAELGLDLNVLWFHSEMLFRSKSVDR